MAISKHVVNSYVEANNALLATMGVSHSSESSPATNGGIVPNVSFTRGPKADWSNRDTRLGHTLCQ
ncbi:Acyl dehydratase [Natrarchaeobaculum sulfurireducens]|uniref:Acyl dehydratase n=1 Tax=Natrarchaeobaculum sulfurireducens TaxID=2044521 RepID=A0A346PG81_9EURY|nr:Acyl dehydratase [Natrarchaeobaculum sulfurireducens]